ncbi:MAG: hypothetical protein IKT40_04570 [Bacilli bacterium]|nr:hypothetical protein [Bacilli bacterium]
MKIVLNERQEKMLHKLILKEQANYLGDKENLILTWLNDNFKPMDLYNKDNFGLPKKSLGVCVLDQNKQVTENIITVEDLFFKLQEKFKKILSDKNDRDELIKMVLKKWYK